MAGILLEGLPRNRKRRISLHLTAEIPGQIGIRYGLPNAKTTSGVILNTDGQVVRRLWGGRLQPEGQYTEFWDGKDDAGVTLDQDDYTPAVLAHNLDYIINRMKNPSVKTGPGQFAQFRVPAEFIMDGSDTAILCSPAYTESSLRMVRQLLSEPGTWRDVVRSSWTLQWTPLTICTDGTTAFIVMRKQDAPRDVIVIKVTLATMALATWSGLTPDGYSLDSANGPSGSNYNGYALPLGTEGSSNSETYTPRKMSVQKIGNALAITQPGQSKVLTVHKGTGATIFTPITTLTNPSCVAWNDDESVLWVSDDAGLYPYIKGNWLASGSAATVGDVNGALGYDGAIMDLKCDAGNNIIGVMYGGSGSHMQVVPINGDDGSAAGTAFGQALGYASDTSWAEDKFHFGSNWLWYINASVNTSGPPGNIDFYSDGSLLVHHAALRRLIKVTDPWGTPSIEVLHDWVTSYGLEVCRNNPARFFIPSWIELSRDYNTELVEGSLDGYAIEAFYGYSLYDTAGPVSLGDAYQVFEAGGRTYAIGCAPSGLYELTSSGMREISTGLYATFYNVHIESSSLDRYRYSEDGNKIIKNTYSGLDGSNNPTWGPDADYLSLPGVQPIPNISTQRHPIHVLSDGSVIVMGGVDPGTEGTYHLMRIASDGTVLWRALPEVTESIPFPWDGGGTIYGNNPPGGLAVSEDDDLLIVSWPGEGYAAGQANAHLLFNLDGIFIEKIGNSGTRSFIGTDYPLPLQSGVAHATGLVSGGGYPRYFFNGENCQSAVTEVRIEGPRQVLSGTGALGTSVNLGTFDSDAYAPDLIGAVSESDSFSSLSGWLSTTNFETITGGARAKSSVHQYDVGSAAIMYRSGSYADGMEFLDIPNPFNGQGNVNGSGDIVAYWGLVGRYNSGTGVRIMAHAYFLYYESSSGATNDGLFRISLGAVNSAGYFYNLGCEYIEWLPDTRDHDYKLGFMYAGASPTRLCVQFWDATTGDQLMKPMQTTLALSEFGSAGAKGIALCGLSQITGWQTRIGTWTKNKPPYLASIA